MKPIYLILLALSLIALYSNGLHDSLAFDDAGEFESAVSTLGIPHSPGHPIFVLTGNFFSGLTGGVGRLWILFPLLSIVCSILILTYSLKDRLDKGVLAFGLILGLNPHFAEYALQGEVYALHFLFLSIIYYALIRERWLLFCYFLGLSLCNNPSHIFTIPLLLIAWYSVLRMDKKVLLKKILQGSFLFFLGLTPYLFLPLRAIHKPLLNWGDPSSLKAFLYLTTAREFSSKLLGHSRNTEGIYATLKANLWLPEGLFIIAIMGLVYLLISREKGERKPGYSILPDAIYERRYVIFLILLGGVHFITAIYFWGNSLALSAYLLPVFVIITLIAIEGLGDISRLFNLKPIYYYLSVMLLVSACLIRFDFKSTSPNPGKYAMLNLGEVPYKGILASENSICYFGVMYKKLVEHLREDMDILYLPYRKKNFQSTEYKHFQDLISPLRYYKEAPLIRYNPSDIRLLPYSALKPNGVLFRVDPSVIMDFEIASNKRKMDAVFKSIDYKSDRDAAIRLRIISAQSGEYFYSRGMYDDALYFFYLASNASPNDKKVLKNIEIIKRASGKAR